MNDKEELTIEEIHFSKERGLHMALNHPLFAKLTEELCNFFIESGAMNYVEFSVCSDKFGMMNVCIQRAEGRTPAQENMRLKEEIEKLKNELSLIKKEPL